MDVNQTEDDDPDWDDVCINIGSGIVRDVRRTIFEKLHYTTSAGIARNKMMAKLGAGYRKPNQQTIVRNRAIQQFLSDFKFTKIRNLGGKLGDQVVETFNTDSVTELLQIPIETLKSKLGDDTGTWLHGIIRGEDNSEVNSRTQIKSMLSAKSFRPSINSFEQAVKWLRIFVSDIYARLVEEGVTENKRRPRTMNLHHRQGGTTRSRQIPIPLGKKIDDSMLFELAKTLMGQVVVDGRAWPCANLSLSVGGFEEGVQGNRGIGSFLVKGDEAKALEAERSNSATPVPGDDDDGRPAKKRRTGEKDIGRFFTKSESRDDEEPLDDDAALQHDEDLPVGDSGEIASDMTRSAPRLQQADISTYFCKECGKNIQTSEREEHQDWHFAKQLAARESAGPSIPRPQANSRPPGGPSAVGKPARGGASASAKGRGASKAAKTEKGQKRLAFG